MIIFFKQANFNETEDDDKKKKRDRLDGRKAGLVATKLAGLGTGIALTRAIKKSSEDQEGKELFNKLVTETKNRGIDIEDNLENGNIANSLRSGDIDASVLKKIKSKKFKEKLKKRSGYDLDTLDVNKDHVRIGKNRRTPEILAHELGHLQRDSGLMKHLNKGSHIGKKITALSPLVSISTGIKAGIDEEKTGKKEGKLSRYGGTILSAIGSLPVLAEESRASINGYKILKDHNASEAVLKRARKNLALAGGTYLVSAGKKALISDLSHTGAKKITKKIYQRRKKKKQEKEEG